MPRKNCSHVGEMLFCVTELLKCIKSCNQTKLEMYYYYSLIVVRTVTYTQAAVGNLLL